MKMSALSYADVAAIEILTSLIRHLDYFGDNPEAAASRHAYKLADALDAERIRRDGTIDHVRKLLERRLATAETSVSVLQADHRDMVALWNELRVDNHPAALLEICRLRNIAGISDD